MSVAGVEGFEPSANGFGDRHVPITPHPQEGAGAEHYSVAVASRRGTRSCDLVVARQEQRMCCERVFASLLCTLVRRPVHLLGLDRVHATTVRCQLDVGAVLNSLMKLRHHISTAVHCHAAIVPWAHGDTSNSSSGCACRSLNRSTCRSLCRYKGCSKDWWPYCCFHSLTSRGPSGGQGWFQGRYLGRHRGCTKGHEWA